MNIFSLESDYPYGSNTYILESNGEAAVIDPALPYSSAIRQIGFQPNFKYIIITHAHFDHFLSVDDWKENTGADVVIGEKDAPSLADPVFNCYKYFLSVDKGYAGEYKTVCEGDELHLGEDKIRFIETFGHTKGSVSILADNFAVVGDTIFDGDGIGRYDLPGGDFGMLIKTIERLRSLPNGTVIYSGHGNSFIL